MCIRDRGYRGAIVGDGEGQGIGGCLRSEAGGADAGTGRGPVSYTHLRAHETVLDLVCRLLLEKKQERKVHTYTDNLTKDNDSRQIMLQQNIQ